MCNIVNNSNKFRGPCLKVVKNVISSPQPPSVEHKPAYSICNMSRTGESATWTTFKRANSPCSSEPSPVSYCYSMLLNSCVTSLHRVTRIVSVLSPFLLDAVFVCFYQCWILESHWLWPHFREWEKLELQWDPKQTNDAFCLPLFLHQFMMHLTRKHLGVQ